MMQSVRFLQHIMQQKMRKYMKHPKSDTDCISGGSTKKTAALLLFLIAIIVLSSIGGLWYLYLGPGASSEHGQAVIAEIYQNGEIIHTIHLDTVTESYTLRIDGDNGAYNVIEIHPGEIGICEASCPDGLCVNMGFIHSEVLPITCLPNKVVIRIRKGDNPEHIDSVVY